MADPQPPPPSPPLPPSEFPINERTAHLSRVHFGVTVPLLAITLIPLSARLYVRIWPKWRFGWDDFLILTGFFAAVTDWALLEREMYFSPRPISFSEASAAVKQAFLAIFFWGFAMTCIKTSVALTLLRIPLAHRAWRLFLYCVLAVQTTYFVGDTIYIFAKCRPLAFAWDLTIEGGTCTDNNTDVLVSSIGSALNALTDICLSIAPMMILWKLRRPRRERILICCLTGMGLFASGASIAKALKVGEWGRGNVDDMWALAVSIATWTIVEQFVAVLAACSPSLKGPIEYLLARCGILLTGAASPHFSFPSMVRTHATERTDATTAAARRREEQGEREVMMERGRSGPVRFRVGEDIDEKLDLPPESRLPTQAGSSNVIPV